MKKCLIFLFALSTFISSTSRAQDNLRQFTRTATLGSRLSAQILLVGYNKDAHNIEKLFDVVIAKANDTYTNLDPANSAGDLGRLISLAGQSGTKVSEEVAFAFDEAMQAAHWTDGRFDIVLGGSGNFKDIKINKGSSIVELKRSGMQIRFDPIISGVLAEIMTRLIVASGMQNAIVKVGNVFRGIGRGLSGPWKIQVQDDEGTFAHHALNLSVINTAVAAISASQFRGTPPINPRTKTPVNPPCRGVVALASDAALAEGLAYAAFISGVDEGQKILSKHAKGLIVDNNGKFIRTPGF